MHRVVEDVEDASAFCAGQSHVSNTAGQLILDIVLYTFIWFCLLTSLVTPTCCACRLAVHVHVHVQHTSEPSASLSELSSAADNPQFPIRRLCTQTGRLVLHHRQAAPASWCMTACW